MSAAPKIYTRQGDTGQTSLPGRRVPKDHPIIYALGDLDEAFAVLGVARSLCKGKHFISLRDDLYRIQEVIMNIGADISDPREYILDSASIQSEVDYLEERIDFFSSHLPSLKEFIVPGDIHIESQLHFCRTVVRRAERSIVFAVNSSNINISRESLSYINRLSDYLFQAARYSKYIYLKNKSMNYIDKVWRNSKKYFSKMRIRKINIVK